MIRCVIPPHHMLSKCSAIFMLLCEFCVGSFIPESNDYIILDIYNLQTWLASILRSHESKTLPSASCGALPEKESHWQTDQRDKKKFFCDKTFLQNELVCGNLYFKVTYTEKISNKLSSYSFFACLKDFAHGPIFWYLDNASTGEPKCSFAVISCDVPYSCLGSLWCLWFALFVRYLFLQKVFSPAQDGGWVSLRSASQVFSCSAVARVISGLQGLLQRYYIEGR